MKTLQKLKYYLASAVLLLSSFAVAPIVSAFSGTGSGTEGSP